MLALRQSVLGALLLASLAACDGQAPPASVQAAETAGAASSPSPPAAFVVFSGPRLTIPAVGEVVDAPTTVGSTPSPATMASTAPGVVEVLADGRLRGVAPGRASVRSFTDPAQALEVEVLPAGAVAIAPALAQLHPGEGIQLALETLPDHAALDPSAVEWSTTAPDVAVVVDGRLTAGTRTGHATIRARLGARVATASVMVQAPRRPAAR